MTTSQNNTASEARQAYESNFIEVSKVPTANLGIVEPISLEESDLPAFITQGSWAPSKFKSHTRNNASFESTSLMVLDIDDGCTLAKAIGVFAPYKHIIATTRSHRLEKKGVVCDRFRVVLWLSSPITDAITYSNTWFGVAGKFPFIDKAAKDPARFYYGCTEVVSQSNSGLLIDPVALVPMPYNEQQGTKVSLKSKGQLSYATLSFLLSGAPEGTWNQRLFKAAKDMQEQGLSFEAALSKFEHMPPNEFYSGDLDATDLQTIKSAYTKEPKYAPRVGQIVAKKPVVSDVVEVLNNAFEAQILIYTDPAGNRQLLQLETSKICKAVGMEALVHRATTALIEAGYDLSSNQVSEMLKTFIDRWPHRISNLPPSFTVDPNELSFNYICLNAVEGPTPTWDDFIGRCGTNGKALMAFTWSILEKAAKHPQYLFLSDSGGTGKGCYTRWLEKLVGQNGSVAIDASNKYWLASCVGKRLGIFPEVNNTGIVMSSKFKAVTGGDSVTIEQKYDPAYSTRLDTKFVLSSNSGVHLSSQTAEKRRCILVEVQKYTNEIDAFEDKLAEETSAFLFKCKQAFNELYNPSKQTILCDYEVFEAHAEDSEVEYEAIFQKCFILEPSKHTKPTDFFTVVSNALNRKDTFFLGNFKKYIEAKHGIKQSKLSGVRVYVGIEIRPEYKILCGAA
jgi:hypothetical protein